MTHHPDPAELDDLVDGNCDAHSRRRLMAHLADCPACARHVTELEQLLATARSLPRRIGAPPQVWSRLQHTSIRPPAVRPLRPSPWQIPTAIAAMLALGAFGVGSLVNTGVHTTPGVVLITVLPSPADSALVNAEARHRREAPIMLETMKQRASALPNPARSTFQQELSVTREAISVARAALQRDSSNQQVKRILAATYDGQLRVLRRALAEANET